MTAGQPGGRAALTALAAAAALGLMADQLLWHGPRGPGLALWVGQLGVAGALVTAAGGRRWNRSVAVWGLVATLSAAGTAWRAAPVLHLLLFAVMITSASVVVLEARGRRFGVTGVADQLYGLLLVPSLAAFGAVPLLFAAELRPPSVDRARARALARGLLLAIPPVTVFAALFIAADPVLERLAQRLTTFGAETLPLHLALVGGFGWLAAGLLRGTLPGSRGNPLRLLRPPRLGTEEIAVVLGLVAVLFAGFVALQAGYLFGGRAALEATTGLTLAEYARRGFFELVAAAALVLALLLAAGAAAPEGAGRWVFRSLAGVLVVLVLPVIASAALRLELYQREFGLTAARVYAAAFMCWVALVLVWFGITTVRERPGQFASGALAAAIAAVFALVIANPEALIARTNLERTRDRGLDTAYLASLGADAVPVLLDGVALLDAEDRCAVATTLLRRADRRQPDAGDWRSWNHSSSVASERLAEARARLERVTAESCGRAGDERAVSSSRPPHPLSRGAPAREQDGSANDQPATDEGGRRQALVQPDQPQ